MSENETSYEDLLEKYARLLDKSIINPEEQFGTITECLRMIEDLNNRIWKHDCTLFVFWMLLVLLYSIVFAKM